MSTGKISIIICSIDAGKFARACANYRSLMNGQDYEIIGIHDAQSLAEGYNRGIRKATGEIMIFSHDDILILDRAFARKIRQRLGQFDLLGFVGTSRIINGTWFAAGTPHLHGVMSHASPKQRMLSLDIFGVSAWPVIGGIKAIDGLCMISTGQLARNVGFDAGTFDSFHLYDLDFSYAAYLAGYRIGVCCDIPVIHESKGQFNEQHGEQAKRFSAKYQQQLDQIDPEDPQQRIRTTAEGKKAWLADADLLLEAWHPELLQRATDALYYATKRPAGAPKD